MLVERIIIDQVTIIILPPSLPLSLFSSSSSSSTDRLSRLFLRLGVISLSVYSPLFFFLSPSPSLSRSLFLRFFILPSFSSFLSLSLPPPPTISSTPTHSPLCSPLLSAQTHLSCRCVCCNPAPTFPVRPHPSECLRFPNPPLALPAFHLCHPACGLIFII